MVGTPIFCAQLSPSFALFTIEQQSAAGDIERNALLQLDIVAHRLPHLAASVEETKHCQNQHLPLTGHRCMPFVKCVRDIECQHVVMYCWNVNDLPTTKPSPTSKVKLCQEVNSSNSNPPPPSIQNNAKMKRHQSKNSSRAARFTELLIDLFS